MTDENFLAGHTSGLEISPVAPPKSVVIFDRKVFVALPWYKNVHPATAFSVSQLLDKRRTSAAMSMGDAFLPHTRNSLADAFLGTDCDYMLSVDDDMILPCAQAKWFKGFTGFDWMPDEFAGLNSIDRLMSHKKSVVGALYFGRYKHGPPVFAEGAQPDMAREARQAPVDKIFKTNWIGTGCILIHRKVFEDIEKRFPRLARGSDGKGGQWFTSSEHSLLDDVDRVRQMLSKGPMDGQKALKAYEILEGAVAKAKQVSGLAVGEDVIFSRRAREAGHDVFVDFGLVCGHVGYCCYGPKNTFTRPDEKKRSI